MQKTRRKCKQCGEWHILPPSKLKTWSGFCNRGCKLNWNQNNISWLGDKCDTEFSKLVREKGFCEKCGARSIKMDCSHVIPRGNKTLRWDILNALCLCHRCHRFWAHGNPLDFTDWFSNKFPHRYDYLMETRNKITKPNVPHLQGIRKAIRNKDLKKLINE